MIETIENIVLSFESKVYQTSYVVIIQEEVEELVTDVHLYTRNETATRIIVYLCVTALFPVFLHSVLSSREGVLVDLGLDLLGRVSQVDGAGGVAGRHLGLGSLHSWEEGAVQ